jgi:hypothetical protein
MRQADAARYIQKYIEERQLQIVPSKINRWVVFEHQGKQLGIDLSSGVWIRASELEDWRCVCKPCNTSGAIQAVEFLTSEEARPV